MPKARKSRDQKCDAWLTIGGETYEGKTGKDCGHAEMDALNEMIKQDDALTTDQAIDNVRNDIVNAQVRTVYCPSRPVCLKCGYVLKKMNFTLGPSTTWGDKNMGSTEWGVSLNVRKLLSKFGIDYNTVRALK